MGTVFAGDDAVLRADGRNARDDLPQTCGKVGYFVGGCCCGIGSPLVADLSLVPREEIGTEGK